MGLCNNCPKKKLTNQFCFEHRVNVCEQCMVKDHPACVVQSYLQWLSSSDYNPVCRICDDHLGTKECIRLVCYDVFHIDCLNDWATRLPPNTAPAGYSCPACSSPVFPASNLVSPVADHLREVLSAFPWARAGLWLPLIEDTKDSTDAKELPAVNGIISPEEVVKQNSSSTLAVLHNEVPSPVSHTESHSRIQTGASSTSNSSSTGTVSSSAVRITAAEDPPLTSQYRGDVHHPSGSSVTRKSSSSDTRLLLGNDIEADAEDKYKRRPPIEGKDPDEDKYKRRSAIEWFSRWWRTMSRPSSRHHQSLIGASRRMIILLVLLGIVTIIVVLSYFARGASDDDPLLDPFNNPNIRVEDK
ncbi:zinc finger protein-like 1 isoform X1 [Macrobrachium nipponense]|uniref:zinc finger protein-like 1 isoform X1 n=1 Tax=Macrobrachium nipponense TaxID=159736 RepID=UPI0030C7D249